MRCSRPSLSGPDALPTITALFAITAGTMFLVWLGQLITENGIGNGVSVIIFAGIVSGMPSLLSNVFQSDTGIAKVALLAALAVLLVLAIVFMQEATRKDPGAVRQECVPRWQDVSPVRSESHSAARELRRDDPTDLRVLHRHPAGDDRPVHTRLVEHRVGARRRGVGREDLWSGDGGNGGQGASPGFYIFVFLLVVVFSFFYTYVTFTQQNLAENLQKQGGFVPGIRPGRPTGEYISRVLVRITWAGALFLGFVAILPYLVTNWFGTGNTTISSTGLLIVVGVVLDTMKQLEAQLLMRNYEGFIR